MLIRALTALLLVTLAATPAARAQSERKTPYWASVAAGEAMMRTGPGRNYPAKWRYVRADLPIQVVEVYPSWRKVRDPAGETGWMLVNLLSDTRTAIVTGDEARPMHEKADAASRIAFRAEPGVVGRLSQCASGWCRLDIGRRTGFIRAEHLWGVDEGERF